VEFLPSLTDWDPEIAGVDELPIKSAHSATNPIIQSLLVIIPFCPSNSVAFGGAAAAMAARQSSSQLHCEMVL
jgi:hypothetical protein